MSLSREELSTESRRNPMRLSAIAWLVALTLAVLYYFWTGVVSIFAAWQKPEYSHGYVIPVLASLLFLLRIKDVTSSGSGKYAGLAVMVFGLVLGLLGEIAAIADIVTYGLLFSIGGIILALLGWRGSMAIWPAWVYLWFVLPLPNFVYWPLSIRLQFISSELGVYLIDLMNVPVYLEGNIIDLGNYQLQVAEACSGLRYLFPLASFSFLFACLYRGPAYHKIIIFLSAVPITILMNSARIAITGVLVNLYGSQQAEGFLHFFEGWVIFVSCIALLFMITGALQFLTSKHFSVSSALDLDFTGMGRNISRAQSRWRYEVLPAAAACLAVMLAVGIYAGGHTAVYPPRERFADFPLSFQGWSGRSSYLDYDIERVLGADDYILADYTAPGGNTPVNLLVAYYRTQNEGSGVHSPEVCIPAGGWEVSRWERADLDLGGGAGGQFSVNQAVIQKGNNRQLVIYWFEQRRKRITNDYAFKMHTVWESLVSGRSDGALVRVVTPIGKDGVAGAQHRLANFLAGVIDVLPDYVPP